MSQRSGGGFNPLILVVVAVVVLVLIVGALLFVRSRQADETPEEAQTFDTIPTPLPAATSTAAVQAISNAIPANAARPTPKEEVYKGCPAGGDGTDPELNMLKNRVDEPAPPTQLAFNALLTLPWPEGINKKHMQGWAPADRAGVLKYNGLGVSTIAYLIRVQDEGPESNNCHTTDPAGIDYHMWIVGNQNDDRDKAVVIELNPRLRAQHPGWTLAGLRAIANGRTHVRITGWFMMDPEHPDQIGKTRGTIWEIHPVTKIEVDKGGGQWQVVQ
jgi:hypothetical protein